MKLEATAPEIRMLLELAEIDARGQDQPPEIYGARREAQRRQVAESLLEPYEALLDSARYPAIVPITRGTCTGCHVRLPTMIESAAARSPSVHRCSHCLRLVYAPQHFTGSQAKDSRPTASPKRAASRRGARASAGDAH